MAMRLKNYITIALLLMAVQACPAQSLWDAEHLQEVKTQLQRPFYQRCYQALLHRADALLSKEPLTVMMKPKTPASGTKHDYMSMARYYWPDPSKPDGLPYIARDGESNPELKELDRTRLGATASRVTTLALAWYFSGEERYAEKATELIRAWFLNKDTRMNPNLTYAQMIPGRNGGKGRSWGVLDGYSFVDMLNGVQLLEGSKAFTLKDQKQLKAWFGRLLKWMLTHPNGIQEAEAPNNHGVACDVQLAVYARYCGQTDVARRIISAFPGKRFFQQIEPDGRMPQELRRTLAFGYSEYNINHMTEMSILARQLGMDIDHQTSQDGRSFYRAVDFLTPYLGEGRAVWPYQQISEWDYKQQEFCKDIYRIVTRLDTTRTDYLRLFQANRRVDMTDPFFLTCYRPTADDDAFAAAMGQMDQAVHEARAMMKATGDTTHFAPCTLRKDGTLRLVGVPDWRVGFFAGTLWELYAYSRDPHWQQLAEAFTNPVEPAKRLTTTHDLGFIINDSFGQGYTLTGNTHYRDVIIDASRSLIKRFNATVGCIRSWDHQPDRWKFPVIIDNMMNLEMLFRATQLTGDSTFWHIAVTHANTTMRNHFRPDYSSYHVVDYDPQTGAVRMQCTAQGYSDDSYWSRGQAWGLYGYTLCYRFTRDRRYLDQAVRIAAFIRSLPMPADLIPYWDMKAPGTPLGPAAADADPRYTPLHSDAAPSSVGVAPRDASAAAVTASALYELADYVSSDSARAYRAYADSIVRSLEQHYVAPAGTAHGFLLLHSTGHLPANSEVDVPLNYADYYYLEALLRRLSR